MACTTILVGKNASYDGSTLVARNEDSGAGQFTPKKFVVVNPQDQPKIYKSVISKIEIPLPDNPMRYTALPNALNDEGIWAACGVNEVNVSMTATETITSNYRVLSSDPLLKIKSDSQNQEEDAQQFGGIGEEDMVTLVLPYIKSARAGVLRLGELLEKYGTYEMNGIAFQDKDEIWWLETIGGHHWIAKRLPDDCYSVIANQFGIDEFDLNDAFGDKEYHLCSEDLREFIEENHLDLTLNAELNSAFNARSAFGSHTDSDHIYNTPRVWISQRYLNPTENYWDGIDADFRPDSDDMPWCRKPEKKIAVDDVKYVLSNHFQGTDYDPYSKHAEPRLKASFRPIGVSRTNVLALVQIRPYVPEEISAIKWIAFGSNVFNAFVPFYANVCSTPDYLGNTGKEATTNSFYWTNRMIAALSDSHFSKCSTHIERYQNKVLNKSYEIIKNNDQKFKETVHESNSKIESRDLLEDANEKIAQFLKKETEDVLAKVLYEASCEMKNGFSRSDA